MQVHLRGRLLQFFVALGLDREGRLTKEQRKEKLATGVRLLIEVHFGRYTEFERADILGELAVNSKLFGTEASNRMSAKVAASVNSCMFSATRLLELIDTSAGSTNDTCCSEIAGIEKNVAPNILKRGKGLFTHRKQITHARNLANKSVDHIFAVDHQQQSPWGDRAVAGYESSFRFMLDAFGLTDIAVSEGAEFAWTCDGARLTTKDNQTLTGLKATDRRCRHPSNPSKYLCESTKDGDDRERLSYHRYQSTDNCILTGAVAQGECKDVVHNCFGDMIKFFKGIERFGLPQKGDLPAIKPCPLLCCADMSLHWKVTNTGGACKVKTMFCHYCDCRSDGKSLFREVVGDERCRICKHNERSKCGHFRHVLTLPAIELKARKLYNIIEEDVQTWHLSAAAPDNADPKRLRDVLPIGPVPGFKRNDYGDPICWEGVLIKEAFLSDGSPSRAWLFDYCRDITHSEERVAKFTDELTKPRITLDRNAADKHNKTNNIEFDYRAPGKSRLDKNTFHANVHHDLRLRFKSVPSGNTNKVELLRRCLELGEQVTDLRLAVGEYEKVVFGRLFNPEQCPPDVLHCHCRIVEKIVQQLLLCGMRNNLGQHLPPFVKRVQDVVNCDILGRKTVHDPAWAFPLAPCKKKLGDVNLSNGMARKFAKQFSPLVEVCAEKCEESQKATWHVACNKFPEMMSLLDSKWEFEFVDIAEFQLKADEFCDAYFAVTGRDGMTNYLHLIRAGHFAWFLDKYGNMYRLSQQGWENVNGRFKRKFFQNSQRGEGMAKEVSSFRSFTRSCGSISGRLVICMVSSTW